MAIKLTYETPSNVTLTDAYRKIRVITASKSGHNVIIDVYKCPWSATHKVPADTYMIEVPYQEVMTGTNCLQNCYAAIIAMPGYELAEEI